MNLDPCSTLKIPAKTSQMVQTSHFENSLNESLEKDEEPAESTNGSDPAF